jgi:hypothetical protein
VIVTSRLEQLEQRRAQLVARSDLCRAELGEYCRRLTGPIQVTTSTFGLLNTLRRSPLFVTAAVAVLMRTPWRRLARVPKLAWHGWRILQFFRGWRR